MGRITKSKIEEIQALLQKGYLQKEVAEKAGVNVRTVSKYDPQRKSKSVTGNSMKRQIEALNELGRTLVDWLNIIYEELELTADKLECPRCKGYSLRFTELDDDCFYLCVKCGYRLIWPWQICRQCFSLNVNYVDNARQYMCAECGNMWVA